MPAAPDDPFADRSLIDPRTRHRAAWVAVLVFAVLSLTCAVTSDGFLTADALTHYLYAKHAFHDPSLLVDVWGRPLVTGLYALPAHFAGRLGVRVTSLLVALVCAFTAGRIARPHGVRRYWHCSSPLAQPLVFLNSFAEMTELPFAALAGLRVPRLPVPLLVAGGGVALPAAAHPAGGVRVRRPGGPRACSPTGSSCPCSCSRCHSFSGTTSAGRSSATPARGGGG
jgi:hypothetical protein